jgi:hypothetical protein
MTEGLLSLWILGAPALLGIAVLRAIGLRFHDDRLGYVAWIWPAGCLALCMALFVYLLCGVEPGRWWWSAPLFALLAMALLAAGRRAAPAGAAPPPVGRGYLALALALSAWCLLFVVAGAALPVVNGDEGNIWSLKAKSLVLDWFTGEFAQAQRWNLHPDYPLLNPLLQAWVHSQTDRIAQFESRWLVQGCALSLLLATAAALRARLPARHAGLLLLLLPFARPFVQASQTAYADGMVALGVLLALDGALRFCADGRAAWAWLAAIGGAFALWSKNEATLYLAAAAGAVLVWLALRRPRTGGLVRRLLPAATLPLLVLAAQRLFNRHFGLQNDLFGANPGGQTLLSVIADQFGTRAPAVLARAGRVLFASGEPHALFGVLLLAPLLWRRAAFARELLPVWLWLAASLAGLHVVYLGSFLPIEFHLDTSYVRVLFQLLPAAMLWFAVLARAQLGGSDGGPTVDARAAA